MEALLAALKAEFPNLSVLVRSIDPEGETYVKGSGYFAHIYDRNSGLTPGGYACAYQAVSENPREALAEALAAVRANPPA